MSVQAEQTEMAYTVAELAARWNCCAKTVRREIERGNLVAFKVGREWRVMESCVTQYERQFQPS